MTFLLQNWPVLPYWLPIRNKGMGKMMCNKQTYSWNISINLSSNYLPKPGQKVPFLLFPL